MINGCKYLKWFAPPSPQTPINQFSKHRTSKPPTCMHFQHGLTSGFKSSSGSLAPKNPGTLSLDTHNNLRSAAFCDVVVRDYDGIPSSDPNRYRYYLQQQIFSRMNLLWYLYRVFGFGQLLYFSQSRINFGHWGQQKNCLSTLNCRGPADFFLFWEDFFFVFY